MSKKLNIGFICTHNSCRSQMAEAIAKHIYKDKFNFYSAGSDMSREIDKGANKIIKDKYNVNMLKTQTVKPIESLPKLDVVITMGCDVVCPIVENQYTEDWDLDDPTCLSDQKYLSVVNQIESKLKRLIKKVQSNKL